MLFWDFLVIDIVEKILNRRIVSWVQEVGITKYYLITLYSCKTCYVPICCFWVSCYSTILTELNASLQVLYGLEYAHIILHLKEVMLEATSSSVSNSIMNIHFADVICSTTNPSENYENSCATLGPSVGSCQDDDASVSTINKYRIGGLTWNLPQQSKMEEYLLFWIGRDNSAFANVVLTFNGCEIGELWPRLIFLVRILFFILQLILVYLKVRKYWLQKF